ncbi:MAG: DivIVA domain-containing protein [Fibrobacterota bacterium]
MQMTPIEIRNYKFRKTLFKGVDPDHVTSFLQQAADEVAALRDENSRLATQLKESRGQIDKYRRIEETLNETLLTAQRATDEARANAQKEAELIIKESQVRADRYEDESRRRVHELAAEIRSLQSQKESFLARFRSMLKDQLSYLEVMSTDLSDDSSSSREQNR